MSVIRAFIAISLSNEVSRALEQVLADLKRQIPGREVRWVAAQNIHLTIKFLGDVSLSNVEALKSVLAGEAARHSAFTFEVAGLGAFPSPKRARVIWVGVQAPDELGTLQRGIEKAVARLGYAPEERPFSPHLTLGRVDRHLRPEELRRLGEILSAQQVGSLGSVRADAIHLYRSQLQPGGPIYTRLASFPLGR